MFEEIIKANNAFIFGFDDVIYPQKDYLLQVYYLFAEFIEYSEQINAKEILAFMNDEYASNGAENLFEITAQKFNIPFKYAENFKNLHHNARLPLKLLLFQNVLVFMQEIVVERKPVYLIMEGDAEIQINKLKQVEWNGLGEYLKVYFTSDFEPRVFEKVIEKIISEGHFVAQETLVIGSALYSSNQLKQTHVNYLSISEIL